MSPTPPPSRIHALTPLLQVFDMPRAVSFYCDVLGFTLVTTSSPVGNAYDWAMLRRDGATLMLNTMFERDERPAEPDAARTLAHCDTILYLDCEDADAWHAHLKASGWPVKDPEDTFYGMRQVYFRDPDGYELCFQHPIQGVKRG